MLNKIQQYTHMNNAITPSEFDLNTVTKDYLTLPIQSPEQNSTLPKELGKFLISKGFIKEIGISNWWWFSYHSWVKKISISQDPLPKKAYEYYVFRLGKDTSTWKQLFPSPDELDQYRFLHETSHAYQDYLITKESPNEPKNWYDKARTWEIDSTFSVLFAYCLSKRLNTNGRGLSTYGNVPDYNTIEHHLSQQSTRAIEDANELVTMYLWNPKYFDTFLDYIAGDIPWYSQSQIKDDGLIIISQAEKQWLKNAIHLYIEEMEKNIQWSQWVIHNTLSQYQTILK